MITNALKIVILNKIAIPEQANSGILYQVQPLPMYKGTFFIKLKKNDGINHFVANNKGKFVELSHHDIMHCDKKVEIRICQSKLLLNRPEYPTC